MKLNITLKKMGDDFRIVESSRVVEPYRVSSSLVQPSTNKGFVNGVVVLRRAVNYERSDIKAPAGTRCFVVSTFQGKFKIRNAETGRFLNLVRRDDIELVVAPL